jgi:excinuclease UvrABC helicase subunit UvrB
MERIMTKAITPTREQLEAFIWDTYKEAHGVRPRWIDFSTMSYDELDQFAIQCDTEAKAAHAAEQKQAEQAVESFKKELQQAIDLGAADEATALRWLTQDETFWNHQDVEHWVWNRGMLFTDYGRELAAKLAELTYREVA